MDPPHILTLKHSLSHAEPHAIAATLRELSCALQERGYERLCSDKPSLGYTASAFTPFLSHATDDVANAASELVNVLSGRGCYARTVELGPPEHAIRFSILERPGEGGVALRLWRSALALSDHVATARFVDVAGKRVIELG
ncbi:MAG: hypothetical protein SGPRY_011122, partial [Prymnesium sp.]